MKVFGKIIGADGLVFQSHPSGMANDRIPITKPLPREPNRVFSRGKQRLQFLSIEPRLP